jgi:hypothetical protein
MSSFALAAVARERYSPIGPPSAASPRALEEDRCDGRRHSASRVAPSFYAVAFHQLDGVFLTKGALWTEIKTNVFVDMACCCAHYVLNAASKIRGEIWPEFRFSYVRTTRMRRAESPSANSEGDRSGAFRFGLAHGSDPDGKMSNPPIFSP